MFSKLLLIGMVCSLSTADSFLDAADTMRLQRNLLQETETEVEKEITTIKVEEKEEPVELANGPTRFYFEGSRKPKFLLEVKEGIILTVFKYGEVWDRFVLDQEAAGKVTGGKNNPDSDVFQVDIDWKSQVFSGEKDESNKINGVQIEMYFDKKKENFVLIDLKIVNLAIPGANENVELSVYTRKGYEVMAPIGTSFACLSPGMFGPKGNHTEETVSAGLTFPEMQLQVYKVHRGRFGPIWECGNMISIGLWVGILVTLMFALVCTWGFTMLANINTMDRFDDPKGKQIYVPQTD